MLSAGVPPSESGLLLLDEPPAGPDKLKLSALPDDKPVKLTLKLPAQVHRDLVAYAEVLGRETAQAIKPAKLIAPMLAHFMATQSGVRCAAPSALPAATLLMQRQRQEWQIFRAFFLTPLNGNFCGCALLAPP
jgi:hypothetical protein